MDFARHISPEIKSADLEGVTGFILIVGAAE